MADVLDICDAIVARIREGWPDPPPATVERVYEFSVPEPDRGMASVDGRKVYVFPAEYEDNGPATRGEQNVADMAVVIVIENYTGDERPVPPAWVDERVRWAREQVFKKVGDVRRSNLLAEAGKPDTTGAYPDRSRCDEVYNLVQLSGHATFYAEFSFTFNRTE